MNTHKRTLRLSACMMMMVMSSFAQSSSVLWSTFDMGFGVPAEGNNKITVAIGQSFVGLARVGNSVVESGFLVDSLLRGPLTGVAKNENLSLPSSYELSQNYPNPFNPTTTIRYALPKASYVTLTVFNIIGQHVTALVNEWQEAGYHSAVFVASTLASGVYFCRLQAGEYAATRKLLLVR